MLLLILFITISVVIYLYIDLRQNYKIHKLVAGDIFGEMVKINPISIFTRYKVDGKYLNPSKDFCGVICGNSMKPRKLHPGDMVVGRYIENENEIKNLPEGKLLAIRITNGESNYNGEVKIRELGLVRDNGELQTYSYDENGDLRKSKLHYSKDVIAIIEKVLV